MTVETGLTIADATAVRPQLAEVRRHLAFIDRKIAHYEDTLND